MYKIHALATVHNRCDLTLKSIESLIRAKSISDIELEITIVDDGSIDNTTAEIMRRYPNINIVQGSGNLYWAGGMRLGFESIKDKEYDFLLAFNDDTIFESEAIQKMLNLSKKSQENIIVGPICSCKEKTKIIYGPQKRYSWHPLRFRIMSELMPDIKPDTFNMNSVLIPMSVLNRIGFLSDKYTHSRADFDYGFRAKRSKIDIFFTSTPVGCSELNELRAINYYFGNTFKETLILLNQPKRMPYKERMYYYKNFGGYFWLVLFLAPYLRITLLYFLSRFTRKKSQ